MEIIYTILKIAALIAVIVIPLRGPKNSNKESSAHRFAVGKDGLMEI